MAPEPPEKTYSVVEIREALNPDYPDISFGKVRKLLHQWYDQQGAVHPRANRHNPRVHTEAALQGVRQILDNPPPPRPCRAQPEADEHTQPPPPGWLTLRVIRINTGWGQSKFNEVVRLSGAEPRAFYNPERPRPVARWHYNTAELEGYEKAVTRMQKLRQQALRRAGSSSPGQPETAARWVIAGGVRRLVRE